MKSKGRHRERALTAVGAKAVRAPGRYADGTGLYLVVDPSGARRWVLRTVALGRRRDIGLGGFGVVSLAQARETAARYRKIAKDGGDPVTQRRRERSIAPTFETAARQVFDEQKGSWKNEKHVAQWITTLEQYVFPVIGNQRVDLIETPDILKALAPIWLTKPETARRVRQRIATVLDWAKASGFRSGDNPVAGVTRGLPNQPDQKGHYTALHYDAVPGFLRDLRAREDVGETAKLAFELLILTATRTSEVIGADWDEIDFNNKVWTIPAARMKGKREHRVPLGERCVEILRRLRELAGDSMFVCPGRQIDKPLSKMAFIMALRRMKARVTAHGFRSAFRDWAAETTGFPSDVCEMALAHAVRDKTEAAYRRGDLFEKRRKLMQAWAAFALREPGKVVALRA